MNTQGLGGQTHSTPVYGSKTDHREDEMLAQLFFSCIRMKTNDLAAYISQNPLLLHYKLSNGDTFLHRLTLANARRRWATELGKKVELVLQNGAQLNHRNCYGANPLHQVAFYCDNEDTLREVFPRLIAAGKKMQLDFNQRDLRNRTILYLAATKENKLTQSIEQTAVYQLLSQVDSLEIDSRDETGETPLTAAIRFGCTFSARCLSIYGASAPTYGIYASNSGANKENIWDPAPPDRLWGEL